MITLITLEDLRGVNGTCKRVGDEKARRPQRGHIAEVPDHFITGQKS